MAFNELIKNFDKIRDYIRDFYVYGFKTREDFNSKSLRSYDNEKRRIESYMGEYMSFRTGENGKNLFISVDNRNITQNPLYRAFKSKSFTKNDITLHFIIFDVLYENEECTIKFLLDKVGEYLNNFENPIIVDESTMRKKLSEYKKSGLIVSHKEGREQVYSLIKDNILQEDMKYAAAYFSEVSPLRVIGSFILDKYDNIEIPFSYKHHYIMHALESEVLLQVLDAIHDRQYITFKNSSRRKNEKIEITAVPVKILISVQSGRRYMAAYSSRYDEFSIYRLDYISDIQYGDKFNKFIERENEFLEKTKYIWNVSLGNGIKEHLEMELVIDVSEDYILNRLKREGKNGTVEQTGENRYIYKTDVYDVNEMTTWVRTFIGRIVSLKCSDKGFEERFCEDLQKMYEAYGV